MKVLLRMYYYYYIQEFDKRGVYKCKKCETKQVYNNIIYSLEEYRVDMIRIKMYNI